MKQIFRKSSIIIAVAISLILLSTFSALAMNQNFAQKNDIDPWLNKPILHYLLYTRDEKLESDVRQLRLDIDLTNEEFNELRVIAANEFLKTTELKKEKFDDVDILEKEVTQSLEATDSKLKTLLGERYMKFREWIRNWWESEVKFRDQWLKKQRSISTQANVSSLIVYATQFTANTTREVALPDQYVKFANIDWWSDIPDTVEPYYENPPYTVNLRCKKVGQPEYWAYNVLVREAGPWNKNDNYWDSATASNPRRKFTDLPLGIPEAERAYLQNYNNGKDEYGHEVLNPAGIDLSFSVASELGLGYLENVWLEVYYTDLP